MSSEMNNKTSVITGAGSGIGLAIANLLARENSKVYILDNNREAGIKAHKSIIADGGECNYIYCDISEEENEPRTVFVNQNPTEMGWEVYPDGLFEILGRIHFDYNFLKLYITENGAAYPDQVNGVGQVDDPLRIAYYQGHLKSVSNAIAMGVPVQGYFAWSLMDNFEWAHGYSKRFGLIYVDYETQDRILKSSAKWYRDVIEANQVI